MNEVKTAAEPLRLQISSPSTSCILPKHPHIPGDPFRKIVLLDNNSLYMHNPNDLHLESQLLMNYRTALPNRWEMAMMEKSKGEK